MNKFLFSIMIAIVGFLAPAMAQDVQTTDVSSMSAALYSEEMTVEPGGQIVLPIYMKNSEPVTLFQTNVYVPEGFSFVKKSNGKYSVSLVRGRLTDEDDNHVISSNVQTDGSLLILCASQDNYTFDGNDGKVATVTISVADNVKGGQYVIKLNNQKLVRPNNMGDNIAEYQVVITVLGGDEAEEAAENFRTDNATILSKTTSTVKSSDIDAINAALEAYNQLSDEAQAKLTNGEKALLDSLKAKAEELKAAEEADAAAAAEANKFKTDNAAILGKTTSTVKSSDLTAITKALDDYSKLSEAAQTKLTNGEKALLDALKAKAEELKAAEEADAATTAEANKFKTDNATILGKTTSTVKSSDLTAITKALDDYSKLSETAQTKLTNGEKALLDALKAKAEEQKAAEEADAAAAAEANKFKTDNATIIGKNVDDITATDKDAIDKALQDYNALSDAAKDKLTTEKTDLDGKKEKVDAIITAIYSVNASVNSDKCYNLNGQRTSNSAKGIVIKNGKKVFVR